MESEFLTAKEAAKALGVSLQTLYVYVGRKGIRSQAISGSRQRRYWKQDIDRVIGKEAPSLLASGKLKDESKITLITETELFYRGRSAIELAQENSFESVASLLWDAPETSIFDQPAPLRPAIYEDLSKLLINESETNRAIALFPLLEEANPKAYDLSPLGMARTGVDVLRSFAAIIMKSDEPVTESLHLFVARKLNLGGDEAELVRCLLILAADHGFEPSAIAVRAAASTGVTPWRAVMTGLMVTLGRRSRVGSYAAADRLIGDILASQNPTEPVIERIRNGEVLPGFSSMLYPYGDPRARLLFSLCRAVYAKDRDFQKFDQCLKAVQEIKGAEPNFALACLFIQKKIGLPPRHTLYHLGRCVGWIAHAIEQYQLGETEHELGQYQGPLPTGERISGTAEGVSKLASPPVARAILAQQVSPVRGTRSKTRKK